MARKLNIVARLKKFPVIPTTFESFEVEDAGAIPTEELLNSPTWSLCCFDFGSGEAIFANTPEDVDLTQPAFYYMAQYEHAMGLAAVPLAEFEQIAETLSWPERVTFAPSTGRCGSTLLSRAFAAIPGTLSISESDDLSQINTELHKGTIDEATAVRLVRAAMKWQGAQTHHGLRVTSLVNKPRAEATFLAKVFQQAVPHAKNLFMYRSAEGWIPSSYNMWQAVGDMDDPEVFAFYLSLWSVYHPTIGEYTEKLGSLQPVQAIALNWCHFMEAYLDLYHEGFPYRALRYEDLVANPQPVLQEAFDCLGLDVHDWEPVLAAFQQDAQESSPLSRDQLRLKGRVLPPTAIDVAKDIIGTRPRLQGAGTILPGTVSRA